MPEPALRVLAAYPEADPFTWTRAVFPSGDLVISVDEMECVDTEHDGCCKEYPTSECFEALRKNQTPTAMRSKVVGLRVAGIVFGLLAVARSCGC
jgi:hypothetical protein